MRKWIVLALFVVIGAPYASADSTESFNFSGTLAAPVVGVSSVSGTFTLDTTLGTITAYNFTLPDDSGGSYTFTSTDPGATSSVTTFTGINPALDFVEIDVSCGTKCLGLDLIFQTSLASFSGSNFYTDSIQVTGGSAQSIYNADPAFPCCSSVTAFSSGSATPVTAPEPSSLALIPLGLGALLLMRKRAGHVRPSAV